MASSETSAKRKYEDLIEVAIRGGATRARMISARDIFIDDRVRLKCLAPLCDNYGSHMLCPPNIMALEEFRNVVRTYKQALLVQVDAPYGSADKPRTTLSARARDHREKKHSENRVHRIVNEVERAAFKKGFYLAAGLIASDCALCNKCVGPGPGRACRHPFEARPSMQSLGIDVIKTCERAGMPIRLSSEEKVRWTGLVLLE